MPRRVATSSLRRTAPWALSLLIVALVLSVLPVAGASAAPRPAIGLPGAVATHSIVPSPASERTPTTATLAPHPSGLGNGTVGAVYNSTKLSGAPASQQPCYWTNYTFANYHYCFGDIQNPSIVTLTNGNLGLGYSIYTKVGPLCNNTSTTTNLTSWTATNIAWSNSLTNGTSWIAPQIIGNVSCRYPSTSEPAFRTGTSGAVYGAFVASNQTVNSTAPYGTQPAFPPDWNDSANATLAFVSSANNGSTWSTAVLIPGAVGVARPQMAVFGQTIYVVYIHIPANSSTATLYPTGDYNYLAGGYQYSPALSVQLVYSANGGSTWNGPYTLAGQNASMGNWSTSPSIAVNSSGTVAVAYGTNRSCVQYCTYPPGAYYGEDIVVARSTTNGSTWGTAVTVAPRVGESFYYGYYQDSYGYQYNFPWETTPQTSLAFGSAGLYLAYAGTYLNASAGVYYYDVGVFSGYSSNGGATWATSTVAAPGSSSNYDDLYSPSIQVSGTTAYIAFVWANNTYCSYPPCAPFVNSFSSWLGTSTDGVTWASQYTGYTVMPGTYTAYGAFQGWSSSVTIAPSGSPISATTLPQQEMYNFGGLNGSTPITDYNISSNISISYLYSGPTTNLTFVEHNLSAGTHWGITVDGYTTTSNASSLLVSNVPLHIGLLLAVLPQAAAYRVIESPKLSTNPYLELSGPVTVDVNYSVEYGIQFTIEPRVVPDADVTISYGGQYYDLFQYYAGNSTFPAMPWYFPLNATIQVGSYGIPPITYWNGTGPGSYTGGGSMLNLTIIAPINETAWAGSYGLYNEIFKSVGLPTTSVYSFTFNGANYTSPATSWLNVSNVGTGGYTVSNITANSSTAGWEYFGWVSGGSNAVVVPATPVVSLQYAFVDAAAALGTVTFHAAGLGAQTVWSVQFNGTYYSSSTPWLNVTTKPGTYPWAVGAAVASNGSVGYAPAAVGSTVSVTTGSTVTINYTSAYRVDVLAGLGGSVSGAGNHWLAAGANVTYTAVAASGYTFGGWTGTGTGAYSGSNINATLNVGGAITETASFYPLPNARFNVTFQETGIVSGAWWTVTLNGVGYSSNSSTLTVSNLLSCAAGVAGQYTVSIPYAYDSASGATRYGVVNGPAPFCTNGGLLQPLTFAPQYQVSVSATSGGTARLANGNSQSNQSVWASPSDTVLLSAAPAAGYTFGGWNGTGTGAYTGGSPGTAISAGSPVTEFATFVPAKVPPKIYYWQTFAVSPKLPAGTTWSVTLSSSTMPTTSYAAVGSSVTVTGLLPGPYSVTVSGATSSDGLTKWTPTTPKTTIHVASNFTNPVEFGKASYWVTIGGSAGGQVTPASGWYAGGTSLVLNASANLGNAFVNWTGTGNGSYSGNASGPTVTVTAPVTEFASFSPMAPATTVITSVWQNTTTWAILGLVGLLAGLVVGIAIRRLRASPASTGPGTTMAPAPTGNEATSTPTGGSP